MVEHVVSLSSRAPTGGNSVTVLPSAHSSTERSFSVGNVHLPFDSVLSLSVAPALQGHLCSLLSMALCSRLRWLIMPAFCVHPLSRKKESGTSCRVQDSGVFCPQIEGQWDILSRLEEQSGTPPQVEEERSTQSSVDKQ